MARIVVFYLLLITALCILQTTTTTKTRELAPLECLVSENRFNNAYIISHKPPAIVTMNTRIKLRCKEQFFDDFTYSVCAGEDLFTAPYPPCKFVKCPIPEPVQHARIEEKGTSTEVDQRYGAIHYTCDDGYWYTGTPTRSCQWNGTWSGENGQCEEVQCPPPPLDHGTFKEVPPFKYNSILTAVCDEGYVYNGIEKRRCQHDKEWSGQKGTCISVGSIRCRLRLQINQYIIGTYNEVVDFTCGEGYIYSGTHRRTCLVNSTWSGTDGICNRVNCTKDQLSIENGWMVGCDNCEYESTVKVLCDKGYQYTGSELVCNEDGNWNGTIGHCQAIHCPASVEVLNGRINISGLSYESTGEITCKPDYRLLGSNVVHCQNDGTWSHPSPCLKKPHVALLYAGIGVVFGLTVVILLLALYLPRRRQRQKNINQEAHSITEMSDQSTSTHATCLSLQSYRESPHQPVDILESGAHFK